MSDMLLYKKLCILTYDRLSKYAKDYCGTKGSGTTYNFKDYKCWNGSKSECENYIPDSDGDGLGEGPEVDCANFASQALIDGFGGKDANPFSCVKDADIIGKDGRTKGEKSVHDTKDKGTGKTISNGLLTHLKNSFCFEVITDPSKAKAGDILSQKGKSHVMIYSGEQSNNNTRAVFYGHTNDRCGSAIPWSDVTIYHYKGNENGNKCERDEKTCKAEPQAKCDKCSKYDPATGECISDCDVNIGWGRCASTNKCVSIFGLNMCMNFGPGGDCPDDTFTSGMSTPSNDEAIYPSTTAEVGVLENGYPYDMLKVLSTFGQEARLIPIDGLDPDLATTMPLLIIPAGGLMGLSDSGYFKVMLAEYVKRGGTVLVLSQQQGYEFFVIPGGLRGFGWSEDQSCQASSAYIDTWHQMLAGQTNSVPSVNLDGYFIGYPENTTVLLRRTANGQPALITYPYENGKIIATSAFTDYAYTSNQASSDEIELLRDIVSWAIKPDTLPEIMPGQIASVNLTVTNNDVSETATAAEVELYDPDRNAVKSRMKISVNLAPGQSTQIPISYTTALTDTTGIYHIKYDLLSEGYELLTSEMEPDGVYVWDEYLLQPPYEDPSGRFVVSNPPGNPYQSPDITFAVNSDSEHYAYGSDATFTVTIWNNGDTDRTITSSYYAYHLNVSGSPKTLIIPAHSSVSFQVIASNITWEGWLVVKFYNENNQKIGERWKGIWMFQPDVDVAVKTDKTLYAKGDAVNITLNLQNRQDANYTSLIKVIIKQNIS
ncbi:MAG: hypothetical protein AB1632_13975 [Nitrospirota bacterium]